MRKRLLAAFVSLCMTVSLLPAAVFAADGPESAAAGLCQHHPQHDETCGYTAGTAEAPCTHQHMEECYTFATSCTHTHDETCGGLADPTLCTHQCGEESGCITKALACKHEHDAACGYAPAVAGTPCSFVCEVCQGAIEQEPCTCTTRCAEESVNGDCPVCAAGADLSACQGAAPILLEGSSPAGDGTKEAPYEISTKEELYWFADQVNSGEPSVCAVLKADIAINADNRSELWTPIGKDGNNQYTGTFNGNGYTISGLHVDSNAEYVGLFGYVGSSGTIQNVRLEGGYISAKPSDSTVYAGGICGYNSGTITNCRNTGEVTVRDGYNIDVGGVCGQNEGRIEDSHNAGAVSGTAIASGFIYVGGVCGANGSSTITNCYNTGAVSGTTTGPAYVGGVCGMNGSSSTITNCYNTGTVSGTPTGYAYVGGVCGQNWRKSTITNCYNEGEVIADGDWVYAGGVCGDNESKIQNCYNEGEVVTDGDWVYAGGVCGDTYEGTITNCYSTGVVRGTPTGFAYVGGVCGKNEKSTITNCYFDSEIAGEGVGNGDGEATGKTVEQFQSGEVAWLLNGSSDGAWVQGINSMPVLEENPPQGVTYASPVRITIIIPDKSTQYGYTTAGSILTASAYPNGYAFFADAGYTTWIDTAAKTYDADTTIYAASPVTNIVLNKNELSLYVNDTETLTATVEPSTAPKALVWSSSDNSVASVDQNGKVTAVGKGSAAITVTAASDSSKTATCKVTVTQSDYSMIADLTSLDFGSVYTGYTQPAAVTVTITNTGNRPLTLTQPASTSSFVVGTLSKTELPVGEKATFTVQPKAGLPVGTYKETIVVSATDKVTLSIPANFTVKQNAERPSTGGSTGTTTGNPGTSSGPDTPADPVYDFWNGVRERIQAARPGDTLRVSVKSGWKVPSSVLRALAAKEDVTLQLDWEDGESLTLTSQQLANFVGEGYFSRKQLAQWVSEQADPVEAVPTAAQTVGQTAQTPSQPGSQTNTQTGGQAAAPPPEQTNSVPETEPSAQPETQPQADAPDPKDTPAAEDVPTPESQAPAQPESDSNHALMWAAGAVVLLAAAGTGLWFALSNRKR